MRKSMIVAMTPKGVIGRDNSLPWPRLKGDLPRFREITMGKPCIMGRKTFDSLPKVLEGRLNIVVSRHEPITDEEQFSRQLLQPTNFQKILDENVVFTTSILEAWIKAAESGAEEAFIIGGAEVYQQAIPTCDRLYLTILSQEFEGDTTLNLVLSDDWTIVHREYVEEPLPYQNIILDRTTEMTKFVTLERLPENHLTQPRYATPQSAGLDFAACLTRPCKHVTPGSGEKVDFYALPAVQVKDHRTEPGHEIYSYKGLVYRRATVGHAADAILCVAPGETVLVPLGFKCSFGPDCVLKLYPRSSVGLKGLVLANGTGIVDADYRGELFAAVANRTDVPIEVMHGERIVQGILAPFVQGILVEGTVDVTERGEGGMGSTGRMAIPAEVMDLPQPPMQ